MITAKEFIKAWQQADSLQSVCDVLGMEPKAASERASRLRKKGVPLKLFSQRNIDYDELAELARMYQPVSESKWSGVIEEIGAALEEYADGVVEDLDDKKLPF